jgi:hypothetical protein
MGKVWFKEENAMRKLLGKVVLFGVLFGSVCFCFTLLGSEKRVAASKKKINLTEKEVNKCIAVLPAFIMEFPEFNPLSGAAAKASGPPNMKSMIAKADLSKLNTFATKNGYKDFNGFARHFAGVISGYMYYKTEDMQKMFEAQTKNLPPATAALMKSQMKPMQRAMKKLQAKVSPELLKAVKPHVAAIDKVMGIQ